MAQAIPLPTTVYAPKFARDEKDEDGNPVVKGTTLAGYRIQMTDPPGGWDTESTTWVMPDGTEQTTHKKVGRWVYEKRASGYVKVRAQGRSFFYGGRGISETEGHKPVTTRSLQQEYYKEIPVYHPLKKEQLGKPEKMKNMGSFWAKVALLMLNADILAE